MPFIYTFYTYTYIYDPPKWRARSHDRTQYFMHSIWIDIV